MLPVTVDWWHFALRSGRSAPANVSSTAVRRFLAATPVKQAGVELLTVRTLVAGLPGVSSQ